MITLDECCKQHVEIALKAFKFNMCKTARALGIDRRTLYRMMQRWGIERKCFNPSSDRNTSPSEIPVDSAEPPPLNTEPDRNEQSITT